MTTRRQPDATLLSLYWGMLWGPALGMWILAPRFLIEHHVRFESLDQRVALMLVLGLIFAALGGFFVLITGILLTIVETVRGSFTDRRWAYALGGGLLLVCSYALDTLLIYWFNVRRFDDWSIAASPFVVVAGACVLARLIVVPVYRRIISRDRPLSTRALAVGLVGAALAGATVAGATGAAVPPPSVTETLKPLSGRGEAPPLLFLGIDGATWRVLRPEIENGSAPVLRRLVEQGTHGTMEALWFPHWSGAAWAAILTGLPREVTGVYEDLAATVPRLPPFQIPITNSFLLGPIYSARSFLSAVRIVRLTMHPRPMLNGKPVWEWLHEAGVDAAVVRFRFTYPPEGRANVVISDRVGYDGWERLGVRRDPIPDAITPANRTTELLAPFLPERPYNRMLFDELLPERDRLRPSDSIRDPIDELEIASDMDDRTFDACESILRRNPAQPFLGVYIAGLDGVEHAFWPYSFPEDYSTDRPTAADVARLEGVLPRYVRFLDRRLGRLLALYKQPPNVVIVSDHGHGATTFGGDWPGWHTREAIVLAAGPSVPQLATPVKASYYDVLPTVLALLGLDSPTIVRGRSFIQPSTRP